MKYKVILFGFLSGLLFWACEDTVGDVGMGILPDEDKIGVYTDTVYLDATTVKLDSIYANTIYGMLGEIYDPTYGSLKSSYMCQFYAPESYYVFPDSIIDNKIDSVILRICYHSYLGDSLAPMEVSVYPITKALDNNYYTNVSPSDYYDAQTVWGRKGYTARDLNVSDSVNTANQYLKNLYIRLPDSLGVKFHNEWKKPAPNAFSSSDAFVKFFPGVYVTPTFGSGSILYVGGMYLNEGTFVDVHFNYLVNGKDVDGNDSTYVRKDSTTFNVTKEIIQLNNYQSSHDEKLLQPDEEKAYVKTPAGIFPKITIPIPDIIKKMGAKKFTNAKLSLSVFGKDEWEYSFGFPSKLLLINPDSVTTFFENKLVANNKTSYASTYGASLPYTYNFGNISAVIQDAITNSPDKNLELLVVPISTRTSGTTDYSTSHYLYPSGITIKKGREHMKVAIVATDMDVDQLRK